MELNERQIEKLYLMRARGVSFKKIAEELGINYTFFSNIARGRKKMPHKYINSFNTYIGYVEK